VAKPRLIDVLDTLGEAISNAVNAAEIPQNSGIAPGQTVMGWAVTTELTKILALGEMNHLIVLWPLKPSVSPIYSPNDPTSQVPAPPTITLLATESVSGSNDVWTFAGSISGAYNVHLVIDSLYDVLVQTTNGQTLTAFVAAAVTAITDADIPGVRASQIGNELLIAGASDIICNISGAGSIATEVDRITRIVQVSTYAPNPMARTLIDDAIIQGVGTVATQYYTLNDGWGLWVRYVGAGETYREKAQSSYSAYEAHSYFTVEYPIVTVSPATQIGVTKLTQQVGSLPSETFYGG